MVPACRAPVATVIASKNLIGLDCHAGVEAAGLMTVYRWSQNLHDPEPAAILDRLGPHPDGARSLKASAPPEPGKPSMP